MEPVHRRQRRQEGRAGEEVTCAGAAGEVVHGSRYVIPAQAQGRHPCASARTSSLRKQGSSVVGYASQSTYQRHWVPACAERRASTRPGSCLRRNDGRSTTLGFVLSQER